MRILSRAKTRYFIPLRVHCWGGFGSQLFGFIMANRLAIRYPKRNIVLIFHSSGVTPRNREIPNALTANFSVRDVDDFVGRFNGRDKSPAQPSGFSPYSILIKLMMEAGILARLNAEEDFDSLKPWLFESRGHYTGISLTVKEVCGLFYLLNLHNAESQIQNGSSSVTLHFRLGDLQRLTTKSHISVERLTNVINSNFESSAIRIISDSSEDEVRLLINGAFSDANVKILNFPTLQVLQECINSCHFIGTNSKISLWIALFRQTLSIGESTYLPIEMWKQFQDLLPRQAKLKQVIFY